MQDQRPDVVVDIGVLMVPLKGDGYLFILQ